MCICGALLNRRGWLTLTMASAAALADGEAVAQEAGSAAQAVLRDAVSVDLHSHAAGAIFGPQPNDALAAGMRAGGLSAVCLAHVADGPVIGRGSDGVLGLVRQPAAGELYKVHLNRLDWVDRLVAQGDIRRVLSPAELVAAKAAAAPALIQDVEGCDFLDGRLERIEEATRRGIRIVQLVHYIPNEIGDFQTGPIVHRGLTEFGARAVRELQRLGIVVDVAHATEATVRGAVDAATRPLLLSHTAVQDSKAMGRTPLAGRQVTPEHARMVAATGGVIGVWHFFPSVARWVQGIREMVDIVGVEHVGIGSDQQVAPGVLQDYAGLPRLADELLKAGFGAADAGRILGGNFMRLWQAASRPG